MDYGFLFSFVIDCMKMISRLHPHTPVVIKNEEKKNTSVANSHRWMYMYSTYVYVSEHTMYMYTCVFVGYAVLPEPTEFKFCGERER